MIDYHVELIGFPSGKVHEAVTLNEDGSYTIFLDKNSTIEAQRKRFLHALKHIKKSDFQKDDIQKIETESH